MTCETAMINVSMRMLMGLLLMVRMLVLVGAVVGRGVLVFMPRVPCAMAVFMVMFMPVGMLVLMAMLMLMYRFFVRVFMPMFVLMFVLMFMLVRMFALHDILLSRTIMRQ